MAEAIVIDSDFDSSDLEFDAPVNPFAHIGRKSIKAIKYNALTDRIESKKRSKSLLFTKGAPGTVVMKALWMNRWEAFRSETLRKDSALPPTGLDIERFFTTMPSRIGTPSGSGIPSLTWIEHGMKSLIQGLTFRYPDFDLSKHDYLRPATAIDKLEKDGNITEEPIRVKQ